MYKCKLSPQQVSNCGRMSSFSQLSYRVCSICINQWERPGSLNRSRHRLFPVAPHRPLQKCFPSISQNNSWAPNAAMHPERRKMREKCGYLEVIFYYQLISPFCRGFQATLSRRTEVCVWVRSGDAAPAAAFSSGSTHGRSVKGQPNHCDTSDHLCQCSRVERSFTGVYVSFTIFVFPSKAVSVGCK